MFEELVDLPAYSGLNDQIYEALRNAILQDTLPAGSKLDVNLLAKRWGVSRTPVNDAIQRLMIEGLVSVVPRRGTFVARIEVKDILEFMDVRLMFELRAAELTIGQITVEHLNAMKKNLAWIGRFTQSVQY
ncbi:MAG: GntR family transcriptional regulator [Negativicutes bacterium]|nr:GntR family transcriptional regulator [Negativicutes bacterium]